MTLLGDRIGSRGRYMEIGVAQGRNLYSALQVLGAGWAVTAFSFERINPPLEAVLHRMAAGGLPMKVEVLAEWTASNRTRFRALLAETARRDGKFVLSGGRTSKKHPGGLKEEDPRRNPGFFPYAATRYGNLRDAHGATKSLTYVHADEYDSHAWDALAKIRARDGAWQMVLSDAEHTEAVVRYECDRLESSAALDFEGVFAFLWDDEMMSNYCAAMLRRRSPKPLAFGAVRVMGRTSWHVWHFATSVPLSATTSLASQLSAQRVAHSLVHANGEHSTC